MQLQSVNTKLGYALCLALAVGACKRSNEAPITGKRSDPPVAMQAVWQPGKRYLYRVETTTRSEVPRKNTKTIIRADTTVGQDLAFTVTNVAPDGSRLLQMEVLAVQMETGRDDGVTMSFDSANRVMEVENTPLVERLRKLVGLKLKFHVSPENKVTRVDGTKDLTDRMSGGSTVRGVANAALSRAFNQQFYRDIVEMGMLPRDPVKVGDTWKVSRTGSGGLRGGSVAMELTYTFQGWQRREGTNCARLDFTGTFKPSPPGPRGNRTNSPPNSPSLVQRVVESVVPPNSEEGEITGQSWFDRELQLAVETRYQQSITTKSTTVRRVRTKAGTNDPALVDAVALTNAPPPVPPPTTNAPAQTVTTSTTSSEQYTSIRLLDVEPLEK